jgi:hypothetical protein
MNLPRYDLKAEKSLLIFRFISEGPKGKITKLIKYSESNLKGYYNLAFGDTDDFLETINDTVISNNGDSNKVLATVIASVYVFTERYKDSWIYARGSTKARTRLYRIGITKYLNEIKKDYEIYGLLNDNWENFETGIDYDAFLVKRINN